MNIEGYLLLLLEKLFDMKLLIFGYEISIGYIVIGFLLIKYLYSKFETKITERIINRIQQ
ncbi:hypothetical protein J3D57_001338 [Bacillus amyloliquefaciens]|nr:hypothetical protein [Bacillus amyloliquefaciens]SLB62520.1 Uncharacterised protein [Mycobacteroides abscessus subsp. massiliense]